MGLKDVLIPQRRRGAQSGVMINLVSQVSQSVTKPERVCTGKRSICTLTCLSVRASMWATLTRPTPPMTCQKETNVWATKDSQGLEGGRWGFSGCATSEAFIYELKASPETWRSFIKLARCGGLKPVQGLMEGKSSQIQTVCILVLSLGWSQVGFIWLDTSDAYQGGAADRVHRDSSCSHMLLGKESVGGAVWLKWVAPVVALPLLSAMGDLYSRI